MRCFLLAPLGEGRGEGINHNPPKAVPITITPLYKVSCPENGQIQVSDNAWHNAIIRKSNYV